MTRGRPAVLEYHSTGHSGVPPHTNKPSKVRSSGVNCFGFQLKWSVRSRLSPRLVSARQQCRVRGRPAGPGPPAGASVLLVGTFNGLQRAQPQLASRRGLLSVGTFGSTLLVVGPAVDHGRFSTALHLKTARGRPGARPRPPSLQRRIHRPPPRQT